ncbi:hypothetical protein [Flavobacterium sp.]|uniref:hypothetical protein n=1 Tax=Flavobacterium sp. TaxID=239 RepID=UPI0011F7D7B5|nr:hypothetical protein [Flavobacterium sp.]RZJ71292.1 MAG: hypothetical protein EOO49_11125 [Flavobacterium sp.]
MKKIVLLAFLVSAIGFSQKKNKRNPDELRFEALIELAENKQFAQAADGFRKFLTDFPNSDYKPRAHYNLGELLWQNHKVIEAANVFTQILDADYNETEAYGGIMEQYALYKNRSASNLAEIYLYIENYELAEKYLVMADKDYPYQHFCGNELTADAIYKAKMYGSIYLGQGKTDKAISVMLPHLFNTGLASNDQLLSVLEKALVKRYTNAELKAMTELAIKTMEVDKNGNGRVKFAENWLTIYYDAVFGYDEIAAKFKEYDEKQLLVAMIRKHPIFSKYL